jgi:hypothetical protein
MAPKAIETRYHDCLFRSRLEARWAVFFDALGVKWEYEKEGYHLASMRYLPDFWLDTVGMWAEVKPSEFNFSAKRKAIELVKATEHPCLQLIGAPEDKPYTAYQLQDGDVFEIPYCLSLRHYDYRFFWWPDDSDLHQDDTLSACRAANEAHFEHDFTLNNLSNLMDKIIYAIDNGQDSAELRRAKQELERMVPRM